MTRPNSGILQEMERNTNSRNKKMYNQWKYKGLNCGQLGLLYGITRQRVRQIVLRIEERERCQAKKSIPELNTTKLTSDTQLPTNDTSVKEPMDLRSQPMETT